MCHIITIFILVISLAFSSVIKAKNYKKKDRSEFTIAMIEPDQMAEPSKSHTIVKPVPEAYRYNESINAYKFGIDVSRYQGLIDWEKVSKDKNASYVYIKATEGATLVDKTYHYNLREARKAGLKVGCYHFFSPTVLPEIQFKNFTSVVKLEEQDLLPMIDVEIKGKGSIVEFKERLSLFLRLVEEHYGIQPIIYTSSSFYNNYLAGEYTEYKYMIARYHDEIPQLVDNIRFVMWQFTASGRINGINGPVDRSKFMGQYNIREILLNP